MYVTAAWQDEVVTDQIKKTNKKINLAPIAICYYYVDENIFAAINKKKM